MESPTTSTSAAVPAVPAPPMEPRREVVIERYGDRPLRVRLLIPKGWKESEGYGKRSWEPPKQIDEGHYTVLSIGSTCSGECRATRMPRAVEEAIAEAKKSAAIPNVHTGDAKLDAVRADVAIGEDGAVKHGRLLTMRTTYSPEILASGPYQQTFTMLCYRYLPGEKNFVKLTASGKLDQADRYLAALVHSCRKMELLGVAPTEAEKAAPANVKGKQLFLEALPTGSYEVGEKNDDGTPRKIRLLRPLTVRYASKALPSPPLSRST